MIIYYHYTSIYTKLFTPIFELFYFIETLYYSITSAIQPEISS